MHMGQGGRRRLTRRMAAVGVAAALVGLGPATPGHAATAFVNCDTEADDIAAVQAAVDAASSGDTIALSGTCDFSGAPAHAGSTTSIGAAAVVVRSAAAGPVSGLTITSAGPGMTIIRGDGSETAFAVLPGNAGVTISNLQFASLGRPVVVLGTDGTTITGNRFDGDHRTNSTVLAVGRGATSSVQHGADGPGMPAVSVTPSTLTNLTVAGNQIFYTPPAPEPALGVDVVGIDVRQATGGTVSGVTIEQNIVAMFAAEFSTLRHNGVRVQGLEAVPQSATPALADYRVTDVTIRGNTLGRLEDLQQVPPGVDPSQTHAAGRGGIVVTRVGNFDIRANRVRARVSTTGGPEVPGGGIIVSDSAFGSVRGDNRSVVVFADPTVPESSDLGAIAVIEGLPRHFGDLAPDQATTDVAVTGNAVGALAGATVETGRGIVLTGGVEKVTVWDNTVNTRARGLYVGALALVGPGALSTEVDTAVLCKNVLDGVLDDAKEVSFGNHAGSAGNAFPGGSANAVQSVAPNNGECAPTVLLDPTGPNSAIGPGEALDVSGRAWGSRAVSVAVEDEDGTVVTAAGTATALGTYAVQVSAAQLAGLDDGVLDVVVTAQDASGAQRASGVHTIVKNAVVNPPAAGTVTFDDGGDGFVNAEEIVGQQIKGHWTASPDPVVQTLVWWSNADNSVPDKCGPFAVAPSGTRTLSSTCGANLAEGTIRFHARWTASDGESSVATASSVRDTRVDPPTITQPLNNATFSTTSVAVAGTATEPGSTVKVTRKQPSGLFAVIATTTADGTGAWSVPAMTFADGRHEISAYAIDPAGNRGPATAPVAFTVSTGAVDTTPPPAPVITSPAQGSLQRGRFALAGTAEPLATVRVYSGSLLVGQTAADASGAWAAGVVLGTGSYLLDADATDEAGNTGPRSTPKLSVEVDDTRPTLTVTSPGDGHIFFPGDAVRFTGTAGDNRELDRVALEFALVGDGRQPILSGVATLTCSTSPPCTSATWEFDASALPIGIYDVTVGAVDSIVNYTTRVVRIINLSITL